MLLPLTLPCIEQNRTWPFDAVNLDSDATGLNSSLDPTRCTPFLGARGEGICHATQPLSANMDTAEKLGSTEGTADSSSMFWSSDHPVLELTTLSHAQSWSSISAPRPRISDLKRAGQWSERQQHQSTIPVQFFRPRPTDVYIYIYTSFQQKHHSRHRTHQSLQVSCLQIPIRQDLQASPNLFHPINSQWMSDVILILKSGNSKSFVP